MSKYRANLPQLSGGLFLADAGIETDLIFNFGGCCGTDLRHVRRITDAVSVGFAAR
jgi:hypothetical protein